MVCNTQATSGYLNISQYDIIISVVAAASLFLLLAVFVIALALKFQKRRQQHMVEMTTLKQTYEQALLQSQIEVQESTFSTLSKELHDNIGQLLSTAKMLLGITERDIIKPPDTLITANETVGKAITELRALSKSLSKEWLEQFNLIENLKTEVNRINSANAINLHLSHPQILNLEADKQIIIFRIIQEAIQNAIKHSSAKNIYISINQEKDRLATTIKDDGVGFTFENTVEGVGILNMKHRAKLLGGTIDWTSGDEGSCIIFLLPVKNNEL